MQNKLRIGIGKCLYEHGPRSTIIKQILCYQETRIPIDEDIILLGILVRPGGTYLHLLPTNYGQSAWNSVKVQPILTVLPPNHARTAAELPIRRNCLHYFRTACTAA